MNSLSRDDHFYLLLHKKIMNKHGSAKRRTKKYYLDQYRKTGIIPAPLLLLEKGVTEGRKCSGRPRSIDEEVRKRFIEMVKASTDHASDEFIFVTRRLRTIKNYHAWLEEELNRPISLPALRRCAKRENLKYYLEKPDFEEDIPVKSTFKSVPVFDLIQMDGCRFRYLKIKDDNGHWKKPLVIELFDTGSRYMFTLQAYFEESNLNSVDLFTRFLCSTLFPPKRIRIRPDNAKGFLNLKRPINALNMAHSSPEGFYMNPDFSRVNSPKDKVHLESSHRSLHNFEARIIKAFNHRIVKKIPGTVFINGKKEKVTVTCLDIRLQDLAPMVEAYRNEHNGTKHNFSDDGYTSSWVPAEKLEQYVSEQTGMLAFSNDQINVYMKYGFKKINATVSSRGIIRHDKRDYAVTTGAEMFSRHKGTPVKISRYEDKLFIFEKGENGILIGEAIACRPYEKHTVPALAEIKPDEISLIISLLEQQGMTVDRPMLVEVFHQGITLAKANEILLCNQDRYANNRQQIQRPENMKRAALFNAFIIDCRRALSINHVATYATHGDLI